MVGTVDSSFPYQPFLNSRQPIAEIQTPFPLEKEDKVNAKLHSRPQSQPARAPIDLYGPRLLQGPQAHPVAQGNFLGRAPTGKQ